MALTMGIVPLYRLVAYVLNERTNKVRVFFFTLPNYFTFKDRMSKFFNICNSWTNAAKASQVEVVMSSASLKCELDRWNTT